MIIEGLEVADIQTVSIAVASASVTLAAIYYMWQIRHQTKVRQTDIVLRLYSQFGSKEFLGARKAVIDLKFKDYNDYVEKFGQFGQFEAVSEVCVFFEGIGLLLYRKLIDINLIIDLFSPISIIILWEKLKPVVEGWRNEFNEPKTLMCFENLYNEIKKREQER